MQRTIEELEELVESYLASSFCILLHTTSIEFSCVSDTQSCLSTQIRSNGFMPASLHSCIGTISYTPSDCTQSISSDFAANTRSSGRYRPFWIVPEFHLLSRFDHTQEGFWYWPCNFLDCIQLIILFELFTKRLQNRCNQFWRIRVQQRSLHLRILRVCVPKLPAQALQSGSPRLF